MRERYLDIYVPYMYKLIRRLKLSWSDTLFLNKTYWKNYPSFNSIKMFKHVTHVIFDMDGLMLDTETIYDRVIEQIGSKYGKTFTTDIRLKIRGTTEKMSAQIAIREMDLPLTPEEFNDIYEPMTYKELKRPPMMPGVRKLVLHLRKHNIPIAIATSSSEESTLLKTKTYQDIMSAFSHMVCANSDPEVKNGKPSPDIYLICASRFSNPPLPEKCLVLEDSPNGVVGAIRAGMQVVMVPAEDVTEELKRPATMILNSLEDFKPELFGLPSYDN